MHAGTLQRRAASHIKRLPPRITILAILIVRQANPFIVQEMLHQKYLR